MRKIKIIFFFFGLIVAIVIAGVLESNKAKRKSDKKGGKVMSNHTEVIKLPKPRLKGTMSVEEAILTRRSVRDFESKPLNLQIISQLLWAAQGITGANGIFRAAPSAGATYPLHLYLVNKPKGVTDLPEGIYYYAPIEHELIKLADGDFSKDLCKCALNQSWVENAPISIIITADYKRTTSRYGERGTRYVHMEAGHAAENLHLQTTALNLGMVVVGAFNDEKIQKVLHLPTNHAPLYIIPVGYPKRKTPASD